VVAVTPDGSQVWVGNILQGNINVINPATDAVVATVSAGSGTAILDGAPIAIAFVKA
jgi:YVTN family beta-propeller protein